MRSKICRLGIGAALAVVIALTVVVVSSSEVRVTSVIGTEGLPLPAYDLSVIPQVVTEDATELATELFGDRTEKCDDFVDQLLTIYSEAKDKDFVMVFNSGGWGWNLLEAAPGWRSIFTGIKSEFDSSGYTYLLLNHQRTTKSLRGRLDELVGIISRYSSKAQDLAARLEFLTDNIPDLRVIIVGECHGAVFTDRVMSILEDNPQVYSIQNGPPFWHTNIMLDRTLIMTDNGIIPDSFSQGDLLAMAQGWLRMWFHLSEPVNDFGTPPHYVGAPGHDYWWQYPKVYSEITSFLNENFGIK